MANAGIESAPERSEPTQWKTFLKAHLGTICDTDFCTVEVLTMTGVVRYFVLFTKRFAEILASAGVETVKLPARSSSLNSFAERFVRSVREDCLRRVLPLGEIHLQRIIAKYVEHYHRERNHQGLDNQLIIATAANENGVEPVQCHERFGGMLRFYCRDAA